MYTAYIEYRQTDGTLRLTKVIAKTMTDIHGMIQSETADLVNAGHAVTEIDVFEAKVDFSIS